MKNATKAFACDICQQRFSRNDHLKRHYVRHTGRHPYKCLFCSSGFARSDVLRNHYVGCVERAGREIPAVAACDQRRQCSAKKLKCDRSNPCSTCKKKGEICSYALDSVPPNFQAGTASAGAGRVRTPSPVPPTQDLASDLWSALAQDLDADSSFMTPNLACFGFTSTIASDELLGDDLTVSPSIRSGPGEPEQPYASALIKALTLCLPQMSQEVDVQKLMFSKIFLMVTARIQRLARTYFGRFHRSVGIIHPASFDPNEVSVALLTAVAYVGGMYSEDISERGVIVDGLDLLECMVFSSRTFKTFSGLEANSSSDCQDDQITFEDLQAGCLVVVAQHCFGNHTAKARAMETRFGELIRVCRKLGLPESRQRLEDRETEQQWLRKEARIRTMAYITLMDRNFHFFHNLPCRLSTSELGFDTPCPEAIFNAEHPYRAKDFRFQSDATVLCAYQIIRNNPGTMTDLKLTSLDTMLLGSVLHSQIAIHLERLDSTQSVVLPESLSNGVKLWYQVWKDKWRKRDVSDRIETGNLEVSHDYWLAIWLKLGRPDSVLTKVCIGSCSKLLDNLKTNRPGNPMNQ
ncbi:hypothetical protein D6D01_09795 [Aureobasidium pullulans]|uniref:C2H2-type domain-containing protein n=1 Tax=Aureobasidium pullulans TaxID=5580 RepID=A0A4S9JY69_AURPU|nr:hypothetical protein D6D01_09795 [Aureobasidium pullulans]